MAQPLFHLRDSLNKINPFQSKFLLYVIQGHVQSYKEGPLTLTLISRINCKRAGTRFHIRGINDQGAVANFVETETLLTTSTCMYSFIQIRGSVPVFWDQPGIQVMGHKVQLTRSREATRPAFERHFDQLASQYGCVTAVNLISLDPTHSETVLGTEYRALFQPLKQKMHQFIEFDFHAAIKGNQYQNLMRLIDKLGDTMQMMGEFIFDFESKEVIRLQKGVFRTNCVDCLDRTNVIQALISEQMLKVWSLSHPFSLDAFKDVWADNGDALSKCYAGTGALKSGYTRSGKRTLAGLIDDSMKSVNRFVINNFQDRSRQVVIDTILGHTKPREIVVVDALLEAIEKEVRDRETEFTSTATVTIHTGTFNVNGKLPDRSLIQFVKHKETPSEPDVLVFGLQEIVELTPGQIVAADPIKRQQWQQALILSISQAYTSTYTLICDGQLVGAAIFVFAKSTLLPSLHELESITVKTGLAGMAGNKGAISVRFKIYDTTFCFVTAHLAAGQNNVTDRLRDYEVIVNETKFRHGKTLDDHDHVIWLGDFNFRINLDYDTLIAAITRQDWAFISKFDQLSLARQQLKAFGGYHESKLLFPPTYKFDVGSMNYDTSAKQRLPAWCDRILFKSKGTQPLTCATYNMISDLNISDHRPVYAVLHAPIVMIHEAKKEAIKLNAKKNLQRSVSHSDLISFSSNTPPSCPDPFSMPPQLPPRPGKNLSRKTSTPLPSTSASNIATTSSSTSLHSPSLLD
ncbi:inositol polyphosphate 5-phosphatase [Coelomomyces lativittatus]|nr:inositol polyphosphate 5-phosphatase [Coelomomyces lativittatus]